jgi:K+-sensing histidine kinase KdpD
MANIPLELPAQLDLVEFISDEAHDLRSPFNQIVGFSRILLNGPSAAYSAEMQKEDLGTVYRSAQRALLLMNGLIDIARLARREKEASPDEVEINLLLEQTISSWRKLSPASTLRFECQISAEASHLVTDELLLRQILLGFSLVVAHYVDPQGAITFAVSEEPAWFIFKVSSAGKKAQPLSKLDLQMQGYIGRALVELQQGEMRLAEETDDGATIQFALPQAA